MNDSCAPYVCDTQWLADNLTRPDVRIVECTYFLDFNASGEALPTSGREAWQIAHIPNSFFIDLLRDLSDPDSDLPFMMPPATQLAGVMSNHGISNDIELVIYDRNNASWATRLWWMLHAVGFDHARVLNGGWHRWLMEGRPVTHRAAVQPPAAEFIVRRCPDRFISKQEVKKAMGLADAKIVCALHEEAYRRGHIPGSLNIPAIGLLDPSSKIFLPAEELAAIFQKAGLSRADRIINYCGGGIAATCCAFAFSLAGYDRVAVYDGSMEEWKRDPQLPVEVD